MKTLRLKDFQLVIWGQAKSRLTSVRNLPPDFSYWNLAYISSVRRVIRLESELRTRLISENDGRPLFADGEQRWLGDLRDALI